ncbi:MAG: hypothetical protein ABW222_02615, partial [Actinomycetota bacterium]
AFLTSALAPMPLYPEYPEIGNPLGVAALADGPLTAAFPVGALLILVGLMAGAGSLLSRFRRAHGLERLQLRWLAWGAALAAVALLVALTALVVQGDSVVLQAALGICVALLPLATGAAILRYRLYDLDRIISRTLAYGLLTLLLGGGYALAPVVGGLNPPILSAAIGAAILRYRLYDLDRIISRTLAYGLLTILLGGAYAVVALGLGQLLGRDSSLAVAGATLAVAAVFQPARRRIQAVVDRRFNRRRHDAARTMAAFSSRLRQQVDLDTLTAEVLGVVDQTMQPTRASLWLRPQPPSNTVARTGHGR